MVVSCATTRPAAHIIELDPAEMGTSSTARQARKLLTPRRITPTWTAAPRPGRPLAAAASPIWYSLASKRDLLSRNRHGPARPWSGPAMTCRRDAGGGSRTVPTFELPHFFRVTSDAGEIVHIHHGARRDP